MTSGDAYYYGIWEEEEDDSWQHVPPKWRSCTSCHALYAPGMLRQSPVCYDAFGTLDAHVLSRLVPSDPRAVAHGQGDGGRLATGLTYLAVQNRWSKRPRPARCIQAPIALFLFRDSADERTARAAAQTMLSRRLGAHRARPFEGEDGMTSRDFCYWLQGAIELAEADGQSVSLSAAQTVAIKNHLALVFKHEIDPSAGPPEHQAVLNKIHHGPTEKPVYRC
jgi:hypothetical protein